MVGINCWCLGINIKLCLVLIYPFILMPLLFMDQGDERKFKCVYSVILTIGYSLFQAFPMEVTFLLPIVLFPVLGILDTETVSKLYMTDTAMMMIGTVCIGSAMETSQLQHRITYKLLVFTGSSKARILLGIMLAAALLSNVLSLVVTVTMLVPTAISIIEETNRMEQIDVVSNTGPLRNQLLLETLPTTKSSNSIESTDAATNEGQTTHSSNQTSPHNLNFKNSLFLGILYGSVIGSKVIIYGNQTTLLYSQILQSRGSFDKSQLSFLSWFIFNLPISIFLLFISWGILVYLKYPKKNTDGNKSENEACNRITMNSMLRRRYAALGPMTLREAMVALLFLFVFLLWFTRNPGFIQGWSKLIPSAKIGDSTPAIFVAILLMVLPYRWPKPKEPYDTFTTWKYFQNRMPWGALIMMGGGIALSEGIVKSGLSDWIGEHLTFLESLQKEIVLIVLLLITSSVTEVVSGKTCLLILNPIMDSLSLKMGLHPLYFGIPAVVSCGYGFMLPTSSTYSALLFSLAEGDLKMMDMIKCGAIMNTICAIVLFVMNITWGEYVFSYNDYSSDSNTTWPT